MKRFITFLFCFLCFTQTIFPMEVLGGLARKVVGGIREQIAQHGQTAQEKYEDHDDRYLQYMNFAIEKRKEDFERDKEMLRNRTKLTEEVKQILEDLYSDKSIRYEVGEELQQVREEVEEDRKTMVPELLADMAQVRREFAREKRGDRRKKLGKRKRLTRWNNTLLCDPTRFIYSRNVRKKVPGEWQLDSKTGKASRGPKEEKLICGKFVGPFLFDWRKITDGEASVDDPIKKHASLGIYNKDLTRGGFFLVDLSSDIFFCREICKSRVRNIFSEVEKDHVWLLSMLENYADSIKDLEAVFDGVKSDDAESEQIAARRKVKKRKKKKQQKEEKLTEKERVVLNRYLAKQRLRKDLQKKHRLISHNFFKKCLLVPFATRFIAQQGLRAARKRMIPDRFEDRETFETYVKDDECGFKPVDEKEGAVLSLFRPVKAAGYLVMKPTYSLFANMPDINEKFKASTDRIFLPEIHRKKIVKRLVDFICVYAGGMIFDKIYNEMWIGYVLKNHEQAIELLKKYEYTKKHETQSAFEKARVDIQKFVLDGHSQSKKFLFGVYKNWDNAKKRGALQTRFRYSGLITAHQVLRLGHIIIKTIGN